MRARSSTGWVAGRPDTTAGSKPISIIGRPTSDSPRTASLVSKSPAPVPDAGHLTTLVYCCEILNSVLTRRYHVHGLNHARYDAGNRLTQAADSVSGTIARGYDLLDRMTSETTPQGSISYTYDAANRRATMTVAGQP